MEDEDTVINENTSSSFSFEFILLLIIEIPSIICTLLILIYLFSNWYIMVKKSLRNHVILILVIISLINITLDLPFTINSYRLGYDSPRTFSFCRWWYWLDYTLIVTSIFLTFIASIQRHFLIFYAHWLRIRRMRWLLHYIPIILCLIYPALYYFMVIILYQCEHSNNDSEYCPQPCYTYDSFLFNYDWIFNTAFPLTTIALANIVLIVRVIQSMKKTRREQALTWKRQRKLTLQLLALSLLYILGWAPSTILSIIQTLVQPNIIEDIPQLEYLNYLTYFVCPLQPFVCLFGLPELTKKLNDRIKRIITKTTVAPIRFIPSVA